MNREPEGDHVPQAPDGTPPSKLKLLFFWLLVVVLVLGAVSVALEGTSSLLLMTQQLFTEPDYIHLPERRHTTYDPDLGWVNLPNLKIDDL